MLREKTKTGVQQDFLEHIWDLIEYWEKENRARTSRDKPGGLAHSILNTLDGCSMLPGFAVIPNSHPGDKEYYIENGEDWYPNNVDIGRELASLLFAYKRTGMEAKNEE